MLIDLLAQFTVEFVRALLIDELSARVRGRVAAARRSRRAQFYLRLRSGRPTRVARTFSPGHRTKVE